MSEIPIYENYGTYKPKMPASKIVRRLLDTMPPEYLRGLGSIVVSSQTALSRRERRKKSWSRGKKIPREHILGYYGPAWQGQPAFIELYVDRICLRLPRPLTWVGLVRDMVVGRVLFHEIGHHLHFTSRPEFREREDVADKWERELLRTAILKRHRYARSLRPLFRFLGFLHKKYGRKA